MAEPFIFINTYRIREGKQEEYKRRFKEVADLVEREEPQMLYFAGYISEDGNETTTFQIHPNAESMEFHMKVAAQHIQNSADVLEYSSMAIQVYGETNEAVLTQMRELAGSGVPVTIKTATAVVNRLPG
jgi:alpha-L-fucosidase